MDNFEKRNMEQDSYKTGSTNPPKSRGGVIAGLLAAVILLAGVSSILGVMNVRLFHMLQTEENDSVSFAPTELKTVDTGTEPVSTDATVGIPGLGLTGEEISQLDQRYFGLPAGVVILDINENSCAAKAGLAAGDIILTFNGVNVLSVEDLEQALQDCTAGESVEVVFYRHRTGEQQTTTVTLGNINE